MGLTASHPSWLECLATEVHCCLPYTKRERKRHRDNERQRDRNRDMRQWTKSKQG